MKGINEELIYAWLSEDFLLRETADLSVKPGDGFRVRNGGIVGRKEGDGGQGGR